MSQLAIQIEQLEKSEAAFRAALMAICREDSKLAIDAPDYRRHPDFEGIRAAINSARLALARSAGWTDDEIEQACESLNRCMD